MMCWEKHQEPEAQLLMGRLRAGRLVLSLLCRIHKPLSVPCTVILNHSRGVTAPLRCWGFLPKPGVPAEHFVEVSDPRKFRMLSWVDTSIEAYLPPRTSLFLTPPATVSCLLYKQGSCLRLFQMLTLNTTTSGLRSLLS